MLLSLGGRVVRSLCDNSGEEEAKPPDDIIKMLTKYGEHGIVVDGIIAWVAVNKEMTAENLLKQLMEKSLTLDEVLKSRAALIAAAGSDLDEWNGKEWKEVKGSRQLTKTAVEDIIKAMTILTDKKKMPLILAGPEQFRRCPGAGSSSQTVSVPELEKKVESLEKRMVDFMEYNKKQMEVLTTEVKRTTEIKKIVEFLEITIDSPGPGKKRKTSERTVEGEVHSTPAGGMAASRPSFSQVAMTGVLPLHPPGRNPPSPQPLTQQMMTRAIEDALKLKEKNKGKPKDKNVFRGNSAEGEASNLAADIDLVASGVARDATEKHLEDYLKAKGLNVVKVKCLTKPELISEEKVRSKTMKVTVKAMHHEKAMDPDMWPYRVGVRHYRAPQRSRQGAGDGSWASQSAQSGGRLDHRQNQGADGRSGRQQQNRIYKNPSSRQQVADQPALEVENRFASLEEQPAP